MIRPRSSLAGTSITAQSGPCPAPESQLQTTRNGHSPTEVRPRCSAVSVVLHRDLRGGRQGLAGEDDSTGDLGVGEGHPRP